MLLLFLPHSCTSILFCCWCLVERGCAMLQRWMDSAWDTIVRSNNSPHIPWNTWFVTLYFSPFNWFKKCVALPLETYVKGMYVSSLLLKHTSRLPLPGLGCPDAQLFVEKQYITIVWLIDCCTQPHGFAGRVGRQIAFPACTPSLSIRGGAELGTYTVHTTHQVSKLKERKTSCLIVLPLGREAYVHLLLKKLPAPSLHFVFRENASL